MYVFQIYFSIFIFQLGIYEKKSSLKPMIYSKVWGWLDVFKSIVKTVQ